MKSKAAVRRIVEELKVLYPNARCSLEYKKDYELLFAVRLSAQCTDARVNMVTPSLYQKFPTLEAVSYTHLRSAPADFTTRSRRTSSSARRSCSKSTAARSRGTSWACP
mgnify:CR=1 FL=1